MGSNVELCMQGAIAGIDTVILDCIDATSANWNVQQNYIHSQWELLIIEQLELIT